MRKRFSISTSILILLASNFLLPSVFAQGLFDMPCPECNGSGEVSTTTACTTCDGSGEISSTSTCSICHGSGQTTVWETCETCYGSGEIAPTITLKSMNGWETLVGLDWVARVEGVFQNEEDTGTYGKATSEVHTVTTTYYHTSPRTYFPPHEDVTITIDTPEVDFLEDWTYTIYISSKDDITCPSCDGSGGESVIATCSECGGSGEVATIETCIECGGDGEITSLQTCPVCNGSGYVTNQTAVNFAIIGVVVVIGGVIGITAFARSRRKRQEPSK